jgi:hypothetical protein
MFQQFIPLPQELLKVLKSNGDTYVAYSSSNEPFPTESLRRLFEVDSESDIEVRTNEKIIDATIQGEKLGDYHEDYPDHEMYGMCRDYHKKQLSIIKLPSDILDDRLIKFKIDRFSNEETLYFNLFKLKFNEDGSYTIS